MVFLRAVVSIISCCMICLTLFLPGMSVEAFAMLMAAVIQGQVLWVYNRQRSSLSEREPTPGSPTQCCAVTR